MNTYDKAYPYKVMVTIHRDGVTGEPVGHMIGLGDTIGDAIQDSFTCRNATKIRDGDFLKVTRGATAMTTLKIALGAKVKVTCIYEWPKIDPVDPPDEIRLTPVPNPHADRIGVVVGRVRRMVCKELDDEGEDPRMVRTDQTALFYVVRYTLTGRGYLTDVNNIEVIA